MDDPKPSTTGERRASNRVSAENRVRLFLDGLELEGRSENLSHRGVLFYTDEPVRVTIELEEDGVMMRRTGQLTRLQSMRGESTGWAVEFDH
jgi:hypothetical protein